MKQDIEEYDKQHGTELESEEQIKKTVEQFSAAPNSLLYPQQSAAKIQQIFERAAKFLKKFLKLLKHGKY